MYFYLSEDWVCICSFWCKHSKKAPKMNSCISWNFIKKKILSKYEMMNVKSFLHSSCKKSKNRMRHLKRGKDKQIEHYCNSVYNFSVCQTEGDLLQKTAQWDKNGFSLRKTQAVLCILFSDKFTDQTNPDRNLNNHSTSTWLNTEEPASLVQTQQSTYI